jgi:hypothetical protein
MPLAKVATGSLSWAPDASIRQMLSPCDGPVLVNRIVRPSGVHTGLAVWRL